MKTLKLRCVVIEDEDDIRQWIIKKIQQFPELEFIGEAANVDEAFHLIATAKPDAAFMDVHLIGGDAFTLLERLQANRLRIPYIVMATGYQEYVMTALNDYRNYIVQYLVKPFVENWRDKFRKAIDALVVAKLKDATEEVVPSRPPATLPPESPAFTFLQNKGSLLRLDFEQIAYLEAAGGGESIVVLDDVYHQVDLTLSKFMTLLPEYFVRISKSNIVNVNRAVSINRGDRTVEMKLSKKNKTLGISDSYYADFLKRLPLAKDRL